jgi:hypothetical protein
MNIVSIPYVRIYCNTFGHMHYISMFVLKRMTSLRRAWFVYCVRWEGVSDRFIRGGQSIQQMQKQRSLYGT